MPANHNSRFAHAELLRSIEDEFVRATSDALGASWGPDIRFKRITAPEMQAADLWFLLEFQQFANAPILIAAVREECLELSRAMATRSGSAVSDEAGVLSSLIGSWSQASEGLAAFLTSRVTQQIIADPVQALTSRPVQVRTESVAGFEVQWSDTRAAKFELSIHPNLLDAVASLEPSAGSQTPPVLSMKNLDLLLDVEMPVSVSFGRAQLPLKDVIKLTTGSIVELSRSVSEPVDIIVNNCVIARGEVVVVDGNFGVRIKEISSKQERLRTLS